MHLVLRPVNTQQTHWRYTTILLSHYVHPSLLFLLLWNHIEWGFEWWRHRVINSLVVIIGGTRYKFNGIIIMEIISMVFINTEETWIDLFVRHVLHMIEQFLMKVVAEWWSKENRVGNLILVGPPKTNPHTKCEQFLSTNVKNHVIHECIGSISL